MKPGLQCYAAFLVSQKIVSISAMRSSSFWPSAGSIEPLPPAAPAGLVALLNRLVQLRVLLEVRRLEVVGPQHPEVVLDQLGALLLDDQRAGAEYRVLVAWYFSMIALTDSASIRAWAGS